MPFPIIPEEFSCPITHQIMFDPVVVNREGNTYEREAIERWFRDGHNTSPMTREIIREDGLTPTSNDLTK